VGLGLARGKYIALLDADDWYAMHHLQRTTDFLEQHPECTLVGTNFFFVNYKGERKLGCRPNEILGGPGDGMISDYFAVARRNRSFPITDCAVFRREKVAELGGFDDSLHIGGDQEFWVRWAMRSRFGYIDQPLCYYRIDIPGSVRKDLKKSIEMRVKRWEKLVSMEPTDLPCWPSFARFRSYYLFRLVALAIAAGQHEEVKAISGFWPRSPGHLYWWLGKSLAALPGFVGQAIHAVLWNFDFVKYRQGKPRPRTAEGE
jgi:hypothetical protein